MWNRPNRLGMDDLLEYIHRLPKKLDRDFILIGFGTDCYRNQSTAGQVEIRGEVSEADLTELLINARAVIIHQQWGAGSLTKITEMLVAGVPVLASETAARSHFEHLGVYTYATFDEMVDLLGQPLTLVPLPAVPAAEQRFVEMIRRQLRPVQAVEDGRGYKL